MCMIGIGHVKHMGCITIPVVPPNNSEGFFLQRLSKGRGRDLPLPRRAGARLVAGLPAAVGIAAQDQRLGAEITRCLEGQFDGVAGAPETGARAG